VLDLTDSSALRADTNALTEQLATDGYLFFRALLPAEDVQAATSAVIAQLRSGGWFESRGSGLPRPAAANAMDPLADPAFRAAVTCAPFNRIPYLPPLRALLRRILGPRAFSYPVKVLRAVGPELTDDRARARYIHCDYSVSGVQDMLTSWLPLVDIPVTLGGLAVRPGGQLAEPVEPRVLSPEERGWATTHYRPGDVLVFHCLTPHAALPNAGSALRLSGDFRWQAPDGPAPAELVIGPGPGCQERELYSGLFGHERWWEPVPASLTIRPRAQLVAFAPAPSRFFTVHRGWQRWRAIPGAPH
jgi:hypothetical protein